MAAMKMETSCLWPLRRFVGATSAPDEEDWEPVEAAEGAVGMAFGSWELVFMAGLASGLGEGGGVGYAAAPDPEDALFMTLK